MSSFQEEKLETSNGETLKCNFCRQQLFIVPTLPDGDKKKFRPRTHLADALLFKKQHPRSRVAQLVAPASQHHLSDSAESRGLPGGGE